MTNIPLTQGMVGKILSVRTIKGTKLDGLCIDFEGANDSEDGKNYIGIKTGEREFEDFSEDEIEELVILEHKRWTVE